MPFDEPHAIGVAVFRQEDALEFFPWRVWPCQWYVYSTTLGPTTLSDQAPMPHVVGVSSRRSSGWVVAEVASMKLCNAAAVGLEAGETPWLFV